MANVSLIIPTRNRKALLAVTLDNIMRQTLQPDEIIVVDDGSDDGTVAFLNKNYADKIIVLANNRPGPGAARNRGLSVATGKYIKFFDSDDLMTNNMIQVQSDVLKNASQGFVYSPYFYATENERGEWHQADDAILNYFPFDNTSPLHYWMAAKNLFITIPGMMFRRELLQEVGAWRTDVVASEDWDYLWRISMIDPSPAHTNKCAFLYRVHGQQTTEHNFSRIQRDKDKYRVLIDIYKRDIAPKTSIGWWERSAFQNKFYQMLRVTTERESDLLRELMIFDTVGNRVIWFMIRIDQKIGRIKTKSNWQPCHGPLISKAKFKEYLQMIIGNQNSILGFVN